MSTFASEYEKQMGTAIGNGLTQAQYARLTQDTRPIRRRILAHSLESDKTIKELLRAKPDGDDGRSLLDTAEFLIHGIAVRHYSDARAKAQAAQHRRIAEKLEREIASAAEAMDMLRHGGPIRGVDPLLIPRLPSEEAAHSALSQAFSHTHALRRNLDLAQQLLETAAQERVAAWMDCRILPAYPMATAVAAIIRKLKKAPVADAEREALDIVHSISRLFVPESTAAKRQPTVASFRRKFRAEPMPGPVSDYFRHFEKSFPHLRKCRKAAQFSAA